MTKKALGTRVYCGSFTLALGNVLGCWPAARLLAREDSRVLSLSPRVRYGARLAVRAKKFWKCEEHVKEEEEW